MKAVRLHQFGGPEVLLYEDAPKPSMKAGEVLVKVIAVGINPPDWYLREGMKMLPPEWRPEIPLPTIPGTDISGIIEAVADDVKSFVVGDEVYGMIRFPSFGDSRAYAQYVSAPVADLALKPKETDHLHAAAAPMAALTAWQFLIERGHNEPNPLQPDLHVPVPLEGRKVLINGAAGGVGHYAVQLAKWKGAYVIAVASGKHEEMLRGLGADEFIDYTQTAPEDVISNLDLVLDTLGGPTTGRFLRTLKSGGALFPVFLGFSDHAEAAERGVTVSNSQVRSNGKQLGEIAQLFDTGLLQTVIDSVFPLEEASKAHERASHGHIQGKIVLKVPQD